MGWRMVMGAQVECDSPECDARENTVSYGYPDGAGGVRYHEAECPPGWKRTRHYDRDLVWHEFLCPRHAAEAL